MAAIAYDKVGQNFMQAYSTSAQRADRHATLAQEADYRKQQLERQKNNRWPAKRL
jgi:hypothetical protein